MSNFIRNNRWLWAVKIVAAAFQIPATWHVFMRVFEESGRARGEAVFSTVMAILLIDCFFLAILYFLESTELSIREKLPWAIVGFLLVLATLAIGFKDEGVMAFAPRLGFIGLVMADLLSYGTEAWSSYFSREAVEQRIRNQQVLTRRRAMLKANRQALHALEEKFVEVQLQRELAMLNIKEPIEVSQPKLLAPAYPQEIEEGIFQLAPDRFGWKNGGDTIYDTTTTGKPYSQMGARRARARAIKR